MLAVEFLDRKNVFGSKATIDEMSKFKSKVKKQTPKLVNLQQPHNTDQVQVEQTPDL